MDFWRSARKGRDKAFTGGALSFKTATSSFSGWISVIMFEENLREFWARSEVIFERDFIDLESIFCAACALLPVCLLISKN